MIGGHRHGLNWQRWVWYLREHYSNDGAAKVAADLSDLSGCIVTISAVNKAAWRYGIKCDPDKCLARSHQNRKERGTARLAPLPQTPGRETASLLGGSARRFCPSCGEFSLKRKDTHCPNCGAEKSSKFALVII